MAWFEPIVSFFGVVAVWIGISVAIIKFLDWALSESQKKKISDRLLTFWNWLDDNRRFLPLRKFQTSAVQTKVTFILTLLYCFGVWAFYRAGKIEWSFFICLELGAIFALIAIAYLRPWIEWMASEENVLFYAVRSTLVFAVMVILPLLVLFGLVVVGAVAEAGFGADISLLNFLLYFVWAFSSAFVTLQVYFWTIAVFYSLAIVILLVLGPVLRFILVRTIEYPKGPVAAISALLTLVGAIAAKIGGSS